MKKTFAPGVLFIFALLVNAVAVHRVSAKTETAAAQVSTTIIISQVYGGGGSSTGTYKFDYIELLNVSATAQSLNGLALQYGSATGQLGGSANQIFALPNVTLQPGQYYLVQTSQTAGTGGVDFPVTPDAITTGLSLSGASGKVALTNTTTGLACGATATPCALPDSRIIDLVSYGASNNAEGNAPVNNGTALTSTQGSVRNANGCTDTDNNNNDFAVVTAPVPRNTASARNACGGGGNPTPGDANVDMNGDGKSDYLITRNLNSLKTWWVSINGTNATSDGQFGLANDIMTPEDFDGDGRDDLAVWRSGAPTVAGFYIYQSQTNTVRFEDFGQLNDDPRVVGDYDGDGKADPAVYRPAAPGQQSFFFYRGSLNNPNRVITFVPWGRGNLNPYNGDFDGDGKNDFCLFNFSLPSGRGQFQLLKSNGLGVEFIDWGLIGDTLVPGDFDGDGRSDFTVVRTQNGQRAWFILERDGGGTGASPILWGLTDDSLAPGDYDGDRKQDIAVWRGNADPTMNFFLIRRSSDLTLQSFEWGQANDTPAASWYVVPTNVATD